MMSKKKDGKQYGKVVIENDSEFKNQQKNARICRPMFILPFIVMILCISFISGYLLGEGQGNNNSNDLFRDNGDLFNNQLDFNFKKRPARDIRRECRKLRCCQYRNENQTTSYDGVQCEKLPIRKCVNNDDVCIWNCDDDDDESRIARRNNRKGRFVGFSHGTGILRNQSLDIDGNTTNDDNETELVWTVEAIMERGRGYEMGSCGVVYETNMNRETAEKIFRNRGVIRGQSTRDPDGRVVNDTILEMGGNGTEEDVELHEYIRRLKDSFFIGRDNREYSFIKDRYPSRVIGRLTWNEDCCCTATLISRRVIVTAAHCVYDTGNNDFMSGFSFHPDDTDLSPVSGTGSSHVWVNRGWVRQRLYRNGNYVTFILSRNWDWALIRLRSEVGRSEGWLSIGYDDGLKNVRLNTFGYPCDKPSRSRWYQYCKYNVWKKNQIRSRRRGGGTCDIAKGQSGSPVYRRTYWSRTIYGIMSGWKNFWGIWSDYIVACRITSEKFGQICDYIDDAEDSLCD